MMEPTKMKQVNKYGYFFNTIIEIKSVTEPGLAANNDKTEPVGEKDVVDEDVVDAGKQKPVPWSFSDNFLPGNQPDYSHGNNTNQRVVNDEERDELTGLYSALAQTDPDTPVTNEMWLGVTDPPIQAEDEPKEAPVEEATIQPDHTPQGREQEGKYLLD